MLKPINPNQRLAVKMFKVLENSIDMATQYISDSLDEYDLDDTEEEYEIYILEADGELRLGVLAPEELAAAPEVMGPAAVYAGGRWYYTVRFRLIYPTTEV